MLSLGQLQPVLDFDERHQAARDQYHQHPKEQQEAEGLGECDKKVLIAAPHLLPEVRAAAMQRDGETRGRESCMKEQIIEMSLNGSGIRDIARVLKISPTTVIEEIKKRNRAERYKYRFAAPA
jgi:hypothetical protein